VKMSKEAMLRCFSGGECLRNERLRVLEDKDIGGIRRGNNSEKKNAQPLPYRGGTIPLPRSSET